MSMLCAPRGRAITASGDSQYSPLKRGSEPGLVHERFGQAVGAQGEAAVLREHHDARAAADVVIQRRARGADIERRGDEQAHRRLRAEEHAAASAATVDAAPSTRVHRQQQPQRGDTPSAALANTATLDRAFVPQLGNQHEAAASEPTIAPTVFHA